MPQELSGSSYVCDCGYRSDHCEGTVRELKEKSNRRPQALIADDGEHEIIFKDGRMDSMYCPLTVEDH
jgi:hypothetical protein